MFSEESALHTASDILSRVAFKTPLDNDAWSHCVFSPESSRSQICIAPDVFYVPFRNCMKVAPHPMIPQPPILVLFDSYGLSIRSGSALDFFSRFLTQRHVDDSRLDLAKMRIGFVRRFQSPWPEGQ